MLNASVVRSPALDQYGSGRPEEPKRNVSIGVDNPSKPEAPADTLAYQYSAGVRQPSSYTYPRYSTGAPDGTPLSQATLGTPPPKIK